MESNCALSKPSDTNTLATSSAEPPTTGSLWQPKQEFEIRPAGAAERRIDAVLELGRNDRLGRLRPSGAVDGGEFRLEQLAPALDEGGKGRWAGSGDRIEIEMGAGRKDALVPAAAERDADGGGQTRKRESHSRTSFHVPHASPTGAADRCSPFVTIAMDRRKRERCLEARTPSKFELRPSTLIATGMRSMCSEMATSHLTLKDIAREAGVSVATLDRVLHGRAGVREETARRVREAIDRHGFRPFAAAAELARSRIEQARLRNAGRLECLHVDDSRPCRWDVGLAERRDGRRSETTKTNVFNPAALARTLESLAGRYDGVAVVALDHQSVRAAIDDLVACGTYVVTLVSDVPGSRRHHYIGIDNVAAGRTAGSLMGRFARNRRAKSASSQARSRCAITRSEFSASTR